MTTWPQNQPGYYPGQGQGDPQYGGPNPGYPTAPGYPSAPGFPPAQQGYPGAPPGYPAAPPGYPAAPGYPPMPGGYPSSPSYGGQPGFQGGPQPGYPPAAGFMPPPIPKPFSPTPSQGPYNTSYGEEAGNGGEGDFDFSDKSIRRGFIRKVYSILMCQLLVSLAFIAVFTYHMPTKRYVHAHRGLFWAAFAIMIVSLLAISCCTSVRRKAPMNFIFLGIFTLAESFILGVTSSTYDTDAVLMAVGLTAAVCFGLTLFAFQTKWDFTILGGGLFVCALLLMIFGIVAIFIPGKTVTLIYASLGALLFSIYLIYDTQMMMGGKHKYSISPEEYIFAALNLYVDIVNIFMYILTIIGASRD